MSQTNEGARPGVGQQGHSTRPGQMTAVMRAMQQTSGPKVLRIGLVAAGRIVEERIVKQRTSVTVGPSEKSMFVVQAQLPSQFKLFELIGGDYYLNFLDGMTGRVALASGITDLVALKGQAKRVASAYQVRLTEEARGKIVIGETTFLFQFVAPPPVQPRPQLPLSVKGGLASQIDWNLTIIAAFSFLLHFGLVGAMYSDWMDPVVNDDITAGLLDMVQRTLPPPVETTEAPTSSASSTDTAPSPTQAPKAQTGANKPNPNSAPDSKVVAGLITEADQARIAILAALNGGPNISGAMRDDNGAPVDLNSLANRQGGISNTGGGLNLPGGAGGPIQPGRGGAGLQGIHGGDTGGGSTSAGTATRVVPVGDVQYGGSSMSVPVSNAEAVIRSQIHPGAKRCYQKGLENDPTQAGKIVILIKVAPSGEVDNVSVSSNSGLSPSVATCIANVARRAKFDAPGSTGSTISVPFNFVKQG
ncbi:MAG: AgmX/PglI C-terminal domain-containing protein [Myxococcota bacterium]|nr:AgmX/PglI C-terminal domain-containing protein [Myxococcota bacterium]